MHLIQKIKYVRYFVQEHENKISKKLHLIQEGKKKRRGTRTSKNLMNILIRLDAAKSEKIKSNIVDIIYCKLKYFTKKQMKGENAIKITIS